MTHGAPVLPGEPGWPEPGKVWVWDVAAEAGRVVTIAEAAQGMTRYARSLGPGTPACGEVERQVLELTGGHPKTRTERNRTPVAAPPKIGQPSRASSSAVNSAINDREFTGGSSDSP